MDFDYKIVETVAVLSSQGNVSKELNLVSYNGNPAKLDLRIWKRTEQGEKLLKGLTLTGEEARVLKQALNARADI